MNPREQIPQPAVSASDTPNWQYPFTVDGLGPNGHVVLGSRYNFEKTILANGRPFFVHPFYNLPWIIAEASNNPMVEVAGPTDSGYDSIDGLLLSSRPIITNVHNDKLLGGEIHVIADAKHLPFADKSIGIMLGSCLPKIDAHLFGSRRRSIADVILRKAAEKMLSGEDADYERSVSPRVGFWLEAGRTVMDGGLVIVKAPTYQDLKMARAEGFSAIAHSPVGFSEFIGEKRFFDGIPREVVFVKDSVPHQYPVQPTPLQIFQGALREALMKRFPPGVPKK